MVLALAYLLGALFLGWLFVVLYRIWRQFLAARDVGEGRGKTGYAGHIGDSKRLAVLLRDEGNWAEWIVRGRVAAAAVKREPEMRVVLVDGGSTDQTPLILERLARQFNLGFCRLNDLGEQCARVGHQGSPGGVGCGMDPLIDCPAPCFEAAGLSTGRDDDAGSSRTTRCVVFTGEGSASSAAKNLKD
ncbi:MAG: hypothetical protein VR67_18635 [Peptococcaceae bacterium BRH_c8a]|nr:MAG: hypothetical protein VR67_18635 [Peptococcaceae bacterium BRH_c8a]